MAPLVSILSQSLGLLVLILVTTLEALFFLQKIPTLYHFTNLSCVTIFFFFKPYLLKKTNKIYLVDFSCLKPPSHCKVPFSKFLKNSSMTEGFGEESVTFMANILASSGQSQETYLPPALHHIPPQTFHEEYIKEVHMVLFPIMDDLLAKTKIKPLDIDILIVNCSGFNPTPSLTSIVVNSYSMRPNVKSFNLSGMGCSAGAVGIDLAHHLLQIHADSYAVVLSTEILSTGWYAGKEKPKLILNCLFRMGSAAVLLTNKTLTRLRHQNHPHPKYELFKTLRTNKSHEDRAYIYTIREEDSDGKLGVTIKRDLLQVAGETLRQNVTVLGESILPLSEKLKHGVSVFKKRLVNKSAEIYVPDFKTVVEHYCLPASGRPVIREIGKGLKLGDRDMEAAVMTLHRFGNQLSSAFWYELAYLEGKERVKKGDEVWQLGMGTGPKCSSLVWKCVRPIKGEAQLGPWADCIDRYPVEE